MSFHPNLGTPALLAVILLGVVTAPASRAERVTIAYEAEVRTVTGQPFGLTVPLFTPVTGYFTYETSTPDTSPTDPMRGNYLMVGTWDFRAEFLDKLITGSGAATASTNLFGYTLSFNDGANKSGRGIMKIDGTVDLNVEFALSITGSAKDLPDDRLPAKFTFNPPPSGAAHTFVLKDDSGQMNLRFLSFRQARPEVLSILRNGDDVDIIWSSVKGMPYGLEFSTDLSAWTRIRDDLVGLTGATQVTDSLSLRYPVAKPPSGFYRIIGLGPSP